MEPKTFEAAITISPRGWKKTDKSRLLEIAESAESYYEREGWQLWYWTELPEELRVALIHTLADVPQNAYRYVWVSNEGRIGASEGDQSGPFDLILCTRPNFPEDWVHIDPDYPNLFFEFHDKEVEAV